MSAIRGEKPESIFKKKVQIKNYKDFFKALLGLTVQGATGQKGGALEQLLDLAGSLGLEESKEEKAWRLLNTALSSALVELLAEIRELYGHNGDKGFNADIENELNEIEVVIDFDFFKNPANCAFVQSMGRALEKWLKCAGIPDAEIPSVLYRFPSFFVFALEEEWSQNGATYKELEEYCNTPISPAAQKEREWRYYTAWLKKQINESVFGERFGLEQIYIPLCAYYEEDPKESPRHEERALKKKQRHVVELESYLKEWLNSGEKAESLCVISGDPGSGKSSFAKIFAAKSADSHKVLFIPLHLLNLKGDLEEVIGRLMHNYGFSDNPFNEDRLLIVFDGLDELTLQGKLCVEVARNFIDEVKQKLGSRNHSAPKLKVLMTGRDIAVQGNETLFRQKGQMLHLLPYYLSPASLADIASQDNVTYQDEKNLLKQDKRQEWWSKYGILTGKAYTGLPEELNNKSLDELTAQPLLNYLVALAYARGKMVFSPESNLNSVYNDLLKAIYERKYNEQNNHPTLEGWTFENFSRVLEEIAVCIWHGTGRTTTITAIESYCEQNGKFSDLFCKFQQDAKTGVSNLLVAFYFRQSNDVQNRKAAFEFTHKSFGEYLLAKKIVRHLEDISGKLNIQNAYSNQEALEQWLSLCGSAPLDAYILGFIQNEIAGREQETVKAWQKTLCTLIAFMLKNGMPFDIISSRPSFKEECRQSRNAEEALLAVLSACAQKTKEISNITWPDRYSAGNWLMKLQGLDTGEIALTKRCLCYLNLDNCVLRGLDFVFACLSHSSLAGAYLYRAVLYRANLYRANLSGADLRAADLRGADLRKANLRKANLREANLSIAAGDDP